MRCAVYEVLLPLMTMITAHRQTHRLTDTQKRKQYIRQFHSVHLADITTTYNYNTSHTHSLHFQLMKSELSCAQCLT